MPVAVAEFQGVLAELARRLGTSVTQLLGALDQLDRAEQYAFITDAYPDLLLPYLVAVGEVTTQFYAEQPTTDDPALFVPEPAVLPATEALSITGRWALTTGDPLASLIAAATKALFDQSRDTVLDNVEREGVKWARYASSTACGFCRMLATRGAVYTSEAAAGRVVGRAPSLTVGDRRAIAAGTLTEAQARANRSTYSSARAAARAGASVGDAKPRRLRGNQQHGERYHRNCRCVATAVRAGDTYEPPAYVQQWEEDYKAATRQAKAEGLTNKRGVPDPAAIAKLMDSAPGARRDPEKLARAAGGAGRGPKNRTDSTRPGGRRRPPTVGGSGGGGMPPGPPRTLRSGSSDEPERPLLEGHTIRRITSPARDEKGKGTEEERSEKFKELLLAPPDDPERYVDGETERQLLRDMRAAGHDYVTVKRLSKKVPDFASPTRRTTLEHKEPEVEPPENDLVTSLGRNVNRATYQSRRVVVDYRQFPSVTEARVVDAVPKVLDRANAGPYVDELFVLTADGGIHWIRD